MTFYLKRPILSSKLSIRVDPLKIVSKKRQISIVEILLGVCGWKDEARKNRYTAKDEKDKGKVPMMKKIKKTIPSNFIEWDISIVKAKSPKHVNKHAE